jgi:hypothetical protein
MATTTKPPLLPFELQTQNDAIARKRKLAEALFAQNATYALPETKGRLAAKANPMEAVIKALGMYLGGKKLGGLDEEQFTLGRQVGERQAADAAAAKKASMVEALVKAAGPRMEPNSLRTGMMTDDPSAFQFHTPAITPHQINGAPGVLETKPTGEQDFKYEPKGTTISIGGEKERLGVLSDARGMLKAERDKLAPMVQGLMQSGETQNLIDRGATVGGGASAIQAVRKFGQAFNVDIPETGLTDAIRGNLEQSVMSRVKEVAPVTETDLKGVRKAVGSLDTDPQALVYLNALSAALTYKKIQDYNRQVEETARLSELPGGYDMYKIKLPERFPMPALAGQFLQNWGIELQTEDGPAKFSIDPFPASKGAVKAPSGMPSRFTPVGR